MSISLSNAPSLSPSKQGALDFIVKAGAVAEEEGHHPDLHLEDYHRDVRVQVSRIEYRDTSLIRQCRGASLMRNSFLRGPDGRPMQRALRWSRGGIALTCVSCGTALRALRYRGTSLIRRRPPSRTLQYNHPTKRTLTVEVRFCTHLFV